LSAISASLRPFRFRAGGLLVTISFQARTRLARGVEKLIAAKIERS